MADVIKELFDLGLQNAEGGPGGKSQFYQPDPVADESFDAGQAVLQGQQQYTGQIATTPEGLSTSTTGAAPEAGSSLGQQLPPEEEKQKVSRTWSAPGLTEPFTQEDFYPNQGPLIGQYSTGTEYVATPGRMPMGAISKAATILNNRQVELDQKRQAFMADFAKVPQTAKPYQQNFARLVQERNNEFVQGIADAMYGGNANKAYRAIASNPELQARWRAINAQNEALAQRGQQYFDYATEYLKKAAKNEVAGNPKALQLAKDIVYGMGSYTAGDVGGDFNKLLNNMEQFDNLMGRDVYYKDFVLTRLKGMADKESMMYGKKTYQLDREGRFMAITQGTRETFENAIPTIAREMAVDFNYGDGETYDEKIADNIEYLRAMLPEVVEQKTDLKDLATGGGGTVAGTEQKGGTAMYQHTYATNLQGMVSKAQEMKADINTYTSKGDQAHIDEIRFFDITAGKANMPRIQTIGNRAVLPVGMFQDKKGKLWVYGKGSRYSGAAAQKDGKGNAPLTLDIGLYDQDGNVDITKFNNLEDVVVPYDLNTAVVSAVTNGRIRSAADAMSIIDEGRAQMGLPPISPSASPAQSTKPNITEDEYKKLKKGEKYWWNGRQLTKE